MQPVHHRIDDILRLVADGKDAIAALDLDGHALLGKKSMTSRLSKARIELLRKAPLPWMFRMISGTSAAFVMLQRPLPVIVILRPGRFIFSSSVTSAPFSAARMAAIMPAGPAPMTRICFISYTPPIDRGC